MKNVLIGIFVMWLAACQSSTYITQSAENSYIQFTGGYLQTVVQVGDLTFNITPQTESFDLNGQQVVKFEIPKGKHQLVVSKGNQVVVKKYIFVTEGQTVEVKIP